MALAVLQEKGVSADYIAGHSLGEYSAIAAAGVVSTADAVKLAALRGKYMQECADLNPGAMAAILGLSPEAIESELAKVPADKGIVQVANFNSTAQSVISGNTDAVAVASELLSEAGARRIVPLPVSGPWHSPLVAGALDKLGPVLDETTFSAPTATLIQNVPGAPVADAAEIRENLKKQVTGSVQWVKTMQYLLDNGVDTVTEVGPGAVLQGLAKAADRKWTKQSYTACL
jgi:[acyl-carrier-protein] S-malonyltransferase